jgi:hypothetical protein
LSINCNFVKPQHTVVTKKILPRFKYDKSKAKKYQLALIANFKNMWVVNLIRHLGADRLDDLIQQCVSAAAESTFGNKLSRGSYREKHRHKSWFDANCRTVKRELRLWLKTNLNLLTVKHQKNKFKNLLKGKEFFGKL